MWRTPEGQRVLQGAEARLIGEVIVALVNSDLYGTGLVDGTLFDGNEWEKQGWVIATEDRIRSESNSGRWLCGGVVRCATMDSHCGRPPPWLADANFGGRIAAVPSVDRPTWNHPRCRHRVRAAGRLPKSDRLSWRRTFWQLTSTLLYTRSKVWNQLEKFPPLIPPQMNKSCIWLKRCKMW